MLRVTSNTPSTRRSFLIIFSSCSVSVISNVRLISAIWSRVVLAFIALALARLLTTRFRLPRRMAITAVFAFILLAVGLFVVFVTPRGIAETNRLIGNLSQSEERLLDSERQCADYTVRFFLTMLAHGVEKVFIHSGASGRVNDPNYECALFDNGSVPRKLFAALAVLTDLLGARPECAAASPLGNFAHAAAFETQGQALVALWSESDALESRVVIPDEQGLRVLDVVRREPGHTMNSLLEAVGCKRQRGLAAVDALLQRGDVEAQQGPRGAKTIYPRGGLQ